MKYPLSKRNPRAYSRDIARNFEKWSQKQQENYFLQTLASGRQKHYNFLAVDGTVVVGRYLDSLYRGARVALVACLWEFNIGFA